MPKSKVSNPSSFLRPSLLSEMLHGVYSFTKEHKIQLFVFFGALLVFFFRRPDAILNAQFWAEDAKWFSEVVNTNNSLLNFIHPYSGYLTTIERLVGWIAGFFPLQISPLIYNLSALSIQALVLVYLWSKRADFVSKEMKVLLSFAYVCLPYTEEIHANITNSQWYLAILLFLLMFIKESSNVYVKYIDRFIILVASLSGPYSIFLMPILIFESLRKKKILTKYYIVAAAAVIQLLCLALTRNAQGANIGYSVTFFFQIIGGQVFGSGLFGTEAWTFFMSKPWIAPVAGVLGIEMMIYVFIKASYVMRYYIAYCSMVFGAALVSVIYLPPNMSWWYYFTTEAFGGRYYMLIHTAVFVTLGWLLLTKTKVNILLRIAAGIILALSFAIGVPRDFEYRPYKDFEYKAYTQEYYKLKRGESLNIPVNPGEGWQATIYKN
ncbi:MAG TPA: hypothetical protein VMR45_01905 [Patescibacteria group bacterium]|nr:hypothetical protein [Patescibacteria group bacterium]